MSTPPVFETRRCTLCRNFVRFDYGIRCLQVSLNSLHQKSRRQCCPPTDGQAENREGRRLDEAVEPVAWEMSNPKNI